MARALLLAGYLAAALSACTAATASGAPTRPAPAALSARVPARAGDASQSTSPVALAVRLAERYWGGTPACGTPRILSSAHELPAARYEATTGPEPGGGVVEMWTVVPACTITINTSIWGSWRQDDESFQWFCDAMTHEVGHLFGHADGGQTDPASVTYPFLDGTSPNFDSVPQCRNVTLRYGADEIRNEEIFSPRRSASR